MTDTQKINEFAVEKTVYRPPLLKGKARRIQIISNGICYGPCPMPEDEVEQHLILYDDGRVWFSGYNYGNECGKYVRSRSKQFKIAKEKADSIFAAYNKYFSTDYAYYFATDIGSWEMTMTNTEGETFQFSDSLCADYEVDGVDLSELMREELGIENLWVFDGDNKPDRVDRITVDYHRVTKIETKRPVSETLEYVTWDYSEKLILDRETGSIEHIQNVGTGGIVSRKYKIEGGVEGILDNLDADSLFENIEGNPPDFIETPNEIKDYTITIDFKKNPQRVISGSFDKRGLPDDWEEFAEDVFGFMRFYGFGEILDPSVYGKAKRRKEEYIYCRVTFAEGQKSYYYISDDDDIKIGDSVFVPAGIDNHESIVKVVDIEYFSEDDAPLPVEKTKHIIRKYTDE